MPAIGPSCRVSLVVLALAVGTRADSDADVVDLIGSMAAALSDNNAAGFLDKLDKAMPGRDRLREAIPALLQQGQIASSVEPLRNEGDDTKRKLDLDWYMEISDPDGDAPLIRRRQVIKCRVEKQGKHWRVVSLDPVSFFDPENYTKK